MLVSFRTFECVVQYLWVESCGSSVVRVIDSAMTGDRQPPGFWLFALICSPLVPMIAIALPAVNREYGGRPTEQVGVVQSKTFNCMMFVR